MNLAPGLQVSSFLGETDRTGEDFSSLHGISGLEQGASEVAVGSGVIGFQFDRTSEGTDRFVWPSKIDEGATQAEPAHFV